MRNLSRAMFLFLLIVTANSYAQEMFTGKISAIPANIKKGMIGSTWVEGCPVNLDEMVYLQLSYWGFDNKPHVGEMIVHRTVAKEVVSIFKTLYKAHFPIESMLLPENVPHKTPLSGLALELISSQVNNTSGFFCRPDTQTPKQYSPHSFGLAIDINPFYNPAIVAGGKSEPEAGAEYLNRKLNAKGMIKTGDIVTTTFLEHGWKWGAYFKEGVDYMHFQKMIGATYVVNSMSHRIENKNPKIPSYY